MWRNREFSGRREKGLGVSECVYMCMERVGCIQEDKSRKAA